MGLYAQFEVLTRSHEPPSNYREQQDHESLGTSGLRLMGQDRRRSTALEDLSPEPQESNKKPS